MKTRIETVLPAKQMARHALSCTTCKPNVATIVENPSHLQRQEALAAIEWCALRAAGRQVHA